MKIRYLFLISLILSIVTMTVLANRSENGNINAVSMYFVVFLIPVLFMVALNVLYILCIRDIRKPASKLILSFLPLCVFILLCLMRKLPMPDGGNLVFVAQTGAIALGMSNLIWIATVYKRRHKTN
jgi:hypothetical protein